MHSPKRTPKCECVRADDGSHDHTRADCRKRRPGQVARGGACVCGVYMCTLCVCVCSLCLSVRYVFPYARSVCVRLFARCVCCVNECVVSVSVCVCV